MNFSQIDPKYIVLAVVVIVSAMVIAAVLARERRLTREQLRERFGPEYSRTVQEQGSLRRAETQLMDRAKRVAKLNIREIAPAERERFTTHWNDLQARFVDSPRGAVAEADDLLISLMQTRGYPMSDFEQRAADISVDHPIVVENYRAAHDIAIRTRTGETSTEDLRKAMIHYRALFEDMVRPAAVADTRRDVA